MGLLLEQNGKYYDLSTESYNVETAAYNSLIGNISDLLVNSSFSPNDLFIEISIGEETFTPIDKFDNFRIISNEKIDLNLLGNKIGYSLLLSNSTNFDSSQVKSLNNINVDYSGDVKLVFSVNEGLTWLTYSNDILTRLDGAYDYPLTPETEEKLRNDIVSYGITPNDIKNVDFLLNNITSIRIAYVLGSRSVIYKTMLKIEDKSHYKLLKSSERKITKYDRDILIQSNINSHFIHVNALTQFKILRDGDISDILRLTAPTITFSEIDYILKWEAVPFAKEYFIYTNKGLLSKTSDTSFAVGESSFLSNSYIYVIASPDGTTEHIVSNKSNIIIFSNSIYLTTKLGSLIGLKHNNTKKFLKINKRKE